MDLSRLSLCPVGCRCHRRDLAVHWDLEELIVPLSSFELMADARDAESTVFGMQLENAIKGLCYVFMVFLDDFYLIFLAFGKRSPFFSAVEA